MNKYKFILITINYSFFYYILLHGAMDKAD